MEKKRADSILEELEELIFNQTFKNGERLDEIKLATQFDVSRTPIREALQKLALSGLVEQIPRRGVFVRHPGPIELIQMFEVMAELEAICARLAAKRMTDEALEEMSEANKGCQAAVSADDPDTYYRANELFHHALYKNSGNQFLEQECLRLFRRLKPFRRLQLRLRGRMPQSMKEHEEILKALADGDSERASTAVRNHVAVQGEKFHHLMASFKTEAAE